MNDILVMGHKNPDTDSICSSLIMANLVKKYGKDAKAVRLGNISKETEFVLNFLKIEAPELVEKVEEGQKLVLVDHNESAQSATGRENAKVLAVVDHHRIADFCTIEPLYYLAKPYGCTATILFEQYKALGIEINKEIGTLMLSAIVSDTLLLKSPTCTETDIKAVKELEDITGLKANEYGLEMLKAGTDLSTYSSQEVINLDAKEFCANDKKIVISQVNTADIEDVFSRKEELEFAMEKEVSDKKLNLFMFVITDIINTNSKIIALGSDKELVEKAFDKKLDEFDSMLLEGVVSRKKQIAPQILEAAK